MAVFIAKASGKGRRIGRIGRIGRTSVILTFSGIFFFCFILGNLTAKDTKAQRMQRAQRRGNKRRILKLPPSASYLRPSERREEILRQPHDDGIPALVLSQTMGFFDTPVSHLSTPSLSSHFFLANLPSLPSQSSIFTVNPLIFPFSSLVKITPVLEVFSWNVSPS